MKKKQPSITIGGDSISAKNLAKHLYRYASEDPMAADELEITLKQNEEKLASMWEKMNTHEMDYAMRKTIVNLAMYLTKLHKAIARGRKKYASVSH